MTHQILVIEAHNTRLAEYVVLGREDESADSFFTRVCPRGASGPQYWGHYRMTLQEAAEDFAVRKNS